jgi:hypothetical protein
LTPFSAPVRELSADFHEENNAIEIIDLPNEACGFQMTDLSPGRIIQGGGGVLPLDRPT